MTKLFSTDWIIGHDEVLLAPFVMDELRLSVTVTRGEITVVFVGKGFVEGPVEEEDVDGLELLLAD